MRYVKLSEEEQNYFLMRVYGFKVPNLDLIREIGKRAGPLSAKGKQRLRVIDWHLSHSKNLSLTARHFAIDRKTLRRWLKRMKQEGLRGLSDRSRCPLKLRTPVTPAPVVQAILKVRKVHPTWSKYKIHAILRKQGVQTCTGTIGRVLKRYGLIGKKISQKRHKAALHPKKRFPKGMVIKQPGQMIQVDTKHTGTLDGVKTYQRTAIDILSRLRVLETSTSLSSRQSARFLEQCRKEFPFPIQAIQNDNGSEFKGEFKKLVAKLNIPQYYTHVRSPKENSYVERSHRTDNEEFYDQCALAPDIDRRRIQLKQWQDVYNHERPHESLGQRTPAEYLQQYRNRRIPTRDYVVLQS